MKQINQPLMKRFLIVWGELMFTISETIFRPFPSLPLQSTESVFEKAIVDVKSVIITNKVFMFFTLLIWIVVGAF